MAAIKGTGSQIWSIIHLLLLLLYQPLLWLLAASVPLFFFHWIRTRGSSARHSLFIICIFRTNKNYLIIVFRLAARAKSSEPFFFFFFSVLGAFGWAHQRLRSIFLDVVIRWLRMFLISSEWLRSKPRETTERFVIRFRCAIINAEIWCTVERPVSGGVHHKFINSLYDSFAFCVNSPTFYENRIFFRK